MTDPRDERIAELEGALRSLANEASGFLEMADIETHGRTNIRCLHDRILQARAALTPKPDAAPPVEELFYIQNKGFCGNCLIWWRPNGGGYTMDLNEAWKVSAAKALDICRSRPAEDIPWAVSQIDAIAQRHVNSESPRDLVRIVPLVAPEEQPK